MGRFEERRDAVLRKMRDAGLNDVADRAGPLAARVVRLVVKPGEVSEVGASKIGGGPDLAAGVAWPEWDGRPLAFLCQVRLADVAQMENADPLPRSGLLSFFYDFAQGTWGFDPNDAGSAVVLYSDGEDLERRAVPEVEGTKVGYTEAAVTFSEDASFPIEQDDIEMEEDAFDTYFEIIEGDREARHQLLGRPDCVQGNYMDLECQLVTNGLYCGDASGYEDSRAKTLEPGAKDWRLLLQLDSDDDVGFMWGDLGRLYFWIREADLEARVFHRVWMILQCG